MNYYRILFLILTSISPNFIAAQKTVNEIKGDKYFADYSYHEAIRQYSRVEVLSTEGYRKMAEAFKNVGKYDKAEELYSKIIEDNLAISEDYYNYAYVLRANGKYETSNIWMKFFSDLNPNDICAIKFMEALANFDAISKDEGRYSIEHLNINTIHQDFGPVFLNDKIVFASSKDDVRAVKRSYNWNQKPFLDIYVSDTANGQLVNAKKIEKEINKKMHEGPAAFSRNGNFMAYTSNNYHNKSKDGVVNLEIFFSENVNGKWKKTGSFEYNNPEYSIGHPWLSEDGNIMYFASNMPGGFGGTDIYKTVRNTEGKWGKPENLGNNINTERDEMFPFVDETSETLFFASNGLPGLGGLDVFMAHNINKSIKKVINLGYPLNTNADDFALIIDKNFKKGYFSSNREGGSGDDDLYSFELLKPFSFGKLIKGFAKDKRGEILPLTEVKLLDNAGNTLASFTTLEDGFFSFSVDQQDTFMLIGLKEMYFGGKNTVSTKGDEEIIYVDVVLEKNPGISLYFQITDRLTKNPISGVQIKVINQKNKEKEDYITTENGDLKLPLPGSDVGDVINYTFSIKKEGYLSKSYTYEKTLYREGQYNIHEELDIQLDEIILGLDLAKIIGIKPIYFDLGKSTITKDAAIELDKIVKVVNENPEIIIELGSHTDCRSSYEFNLKLSEARAKSSAAYIKKNITSPERIYSKGYGESKLKNDCACEGIVVSDCNEDQHQENRRTEFVIIKL